jgi:hypothetical protein
VNKFVQKLGVMDGFQVRAQLWVVLPEAIHAMRTVRDDPLRASPHSESLESFDVLSGKLLKQQFVTHTPGRLARTTFSIAKHSEIDVGCLHEFHNTASDLLQTTVVGRGATDPVEHFAIGIVLHVWNAKAGGPRHTILRRHPPRVAGATGLLQRLSWRSAKLPVGHQGSPHIHDKPQGAYAEGTNIHASRAGRACPQSLV